MQAKLNWHTIINKTNIFQAWSTWKKQTKANKSFLVPCELNSTGNYMKQHISIKISVQIINDTAEIQKIKDAMVTKPLIAFIGRLLQLKSQSQARRL